MVANRRDSDAWLQRTSQAMGVTIAQLSEMSVDDIIEKTNMAKTDAYSVRRLASSEINSADADHSLAKRILNVLKNGPAPEVESLRSALFFAYEDLQASNKDITKAIWSLQKRSLVTFYERKAGRDSLLTQIKLTRQGMREMGLAPDHDSTRPGKVKPSRELKRRSPVGKDMTDEIQHGSIANGGPVSVVHEGIPVYKEQVIDRAARNLTSPAPRLDPPRQNEKPFIDEGSRDTTSPHTSASTSHTSARQHILDTHTEYPMIAELLGRGDKQAAFELAAEALEGVDDVTAAALRNRVKPLSPLEAEIVRLVGEL
jgi:hypothetical protein